MIDLEILKKSLSAMGSDYVMFDGVDVKRRTSNIFSRWFNRRCAQFCESSRYKNMIICKNFLRLIKEDDVYGDFSDVARDAMGGDRRINSGKPLSARRVVKVIDELFKKRNPERIRQIDQYGRDLLQCGSIRFMGNIIDAEPKPRGGFPYIEQQLGIYIKPMNFGSDDATQKAAFDAGMYLDSLRHSVMDSLKYECKHLKDPISDDLFRSVTMKVLVEEELKRKYFSSKYVIWTTAFFLNNGEGFKENYAFVGRKLETLKLPVPSEDEYMDELEKAIKYAAEHWTEDLDLISTMQPDAYAERYIRTACRRGAVNVLPSLGDNSSGE